MAGRVSMRVETVPEHVPYASNSRPRDKTADPVFTARPHVTIVRVRLLSRKLRQDVTLQLGTLQETVMVRLSLREPMTTASPPSHTWT
jgi:hypothetical protein